MQSLPTKPTASHRPRAGSSQIEASALRPGEVIGQARREERCPSASVERRNEAGAPQAATREGRVLLRRGFVARLACSAEATRLHLAPARIAKSLRRRDSIWLDPALDARGEEDSLMNESSPPFWGYHQHLPGRAGRPAALAA